MINPTLPDKNEMINTNVQSIIDQARSFYPELKDIIIEFRMVTAMKKALMLAQPKVITLFGPKGDREYLVKISNTLQLEDYMIPVSDMPKDVLVGWIGHELGHIMDYQNRSLAGMLRFGLGYWLSSNYIRKAEYVADNYAIKNGLGDKIIKTKNFILDHAHIPDRYKQKITRLYMSPEEVLAKVKEIEATVKPVSQSSPNL